MPSTEAPSGAAHRVHDQRNEADRRVDELLAADGGLSAPEPQTRLERYWPNALEEKRRGVLLELPSHVWARRDVGGPVFTPPSNLVELLGERAAQLSRSPAADTTSAARRGRAPRGAVVRDSPAKQLEQFAGRLSRQQPTVA